MRIALALLTATIALTAPLSQAAKFDYSYTFGSGAVVAGSFTGTANGNLITDLSDISASLNGIGFAPTLYGIGYSNYAPNAYRWVPTGAVASFDGTQNQFMFADDTMTPGHDSLQTYFFIVTSIIGGVAYPEAFATLLNDGTHVEVDGVFRPYRYSPARWSVTAVAAPVPEPETYAMMLAGLGLLGVMTRRRKQK